LWDEHRLLALGLCSLFFLGSGLIALSTARSTARRDGKPLAATLDELAQDQAALRTPPRS
jgi:uncharacterized membrane protein YqjE